MVVGHDGQRTSGKNTRLARQFEAIGNVGTVVLLFMLGARGGLEQVGWHACLAEIMGQRPKREIRKFAGR
jgi:hypothetical protein